MTKPTPAKQAVIVRVDAKTKASLQKLAERDHRSLESYMRLVIEAHLTSIKTK